MKSDLVPVVCILCTSLCISDPIFSSSASPVMINGLVTPINFLFNFLPWQTCFLIIKVCHDILNRSSSLTLLNMLQQNSLACWSTAQRGNSPVYSKVS